MNSKPTLLIVAGEQSGDMHAARLVKAFHQINPDAEFFGIGGPEMRAEEVKTLYDVKEMAVMGFSAVLAKYPFFKRVFNEVLDEAKKRKPDVAILVDYPGFNLRLAKKLHEMGITVIYYICPQVWAWNRSRITTMGKILDQLITIFPFEAKHFEQTGLKVDFVGHPLVEKAEKARAESPDTLPWNGKPQIALLPGSRTQEVERIFPPMWRAAELIQKKHPDASFIICAASIQMKDEITEKIRSLGKGPQNITIVTDNTRQVLLQSTAALVASGTATIETALMGCPMVIAYKTSALTYTLGKMLVKIDNIGMVNIVAGKTICPELIQGAATAGNLAKEIEPLLSETPERSRMVENLKTVSESLGKTGVEERAAKIIQDNLQ
ncbi:lipid-A-disaccharide synthase [bacterium B17]|nr:lipid-A-disaccharide synthase [bacterium B17]